MICDEKFTKMAKTCFRAARHRMRTYAIEQSTRLLVIYAVFRYTRSALLLGTFCSLGLGIRPARENLPLFFLLRIDSKCLTLVLVAASHSQTYRRDLEFAEIAIQLMTGSNKILAILFWVVAMATQFRF
jgi:hypothetical protein